jgi:hypothetical protein
MSSFRISRAPHFLGLRTALIVLGLAGCKDEIPSNERAAANALSQLVWAENQLPAMKLPYWTGDVTELFRLGLVPREIAEADASPLKPLVTPPKPYRGYLFVSMDWDDTGEKPEPLKQDVDGTGKVHHKRKAAWCAYPSVPGKTGRRTYFSCVGMDGAGQLLGLYNNGQPVLRWPKGGNNAAGWSVVD